MLWQWLQQMERSGAERVTASRATSHTQCAVNWQETRKQRADEALVTSSARLLLIASGSLPDAAGPPPPSKGATQTVVVQGRVGRESEVKQQHGAPKT